MQENDFFERFSIISKDWTNNNKTCLRTNRSCCCLLEISIQNEQKIKPIIKDNLSSINSF